jgi:hypothetical protein
MRGAPELEPNDIGDVQKFNDFLKRHATYAAQAREQGCSWSSVAGLLSRYSEDLAIAFSAVALKRGDHRQYDSNAVLNLSDDMFEKLYVEACCPSVEYPSQVIAQLESTAFVRQCPHEASPLPAVLRAAEAFRVQLRLLPTHAVGQCTPEALRNAWFQLLFGDDAPRKRMDFQTCTTWEQARTALIQRATSQAAWFGEIMRDSSTHARLSSSAPSVSSTQSGGSTAKPVKTQSYYEKRNEQLKKEGAFEELDLEGMTPKQIYKAGTAARHKAKAAKEQAAKDVETKKFQESLSKQQQDFQASVQRQLVHQQSTLLSAITKQPNSREPSRERDHFRSHSADQQRAREYPQSDRYGGTSDNRRTFNHDRRPSQDTTAGNATSKEERRGQSPRPPSNSEGPNRQHPGSLSQSSFRVGQEPTRTVVSNNPK